MEYRSPPYGWLHAFPVPDAVGIIEEFFQQFVIIFSNGFHQMLASCSFIRPYRPGWALPGMKVIPSVSSQMIPFMVMGSTTPLKLSSGTDRQLQGNGFGTQHFLNLLNNVQEVGTATVHFINETDTRYPITVGLAPYGFD